MASRRDQVDAQKYLNARLTSALLNGDPDAIEPPTRRDARGVVGGLALASLLVVGVGLYAMFANGGSTAWMQRNVLVVDKDDGGRFVLVDGRLHPVRNLASAKLLLGQQMTPVAVSAKVLADTPRGPAVGIVGAPDGLPGAAAAGGVWRDCATTPTDRLPASAAVRDVVEVGAAPAPAAPGPVLVRAGTRLLLVQGGVWHAVDQQWIGVLGLGQTTPIDVSATWVSLLRQGPPIAPLPVPGDGSPGPALDGRPTTIGQLFDTGSSQADQGHYQLRQDGLLVLTPLQFRLASAQRGGQRAVLSDYAVAQAKRAAAPPQAAQLPRTAPVVEQPPAGALPCVQIRPDRAGGATRPQLVLAPLARRASVVTTGAAAGSTAVLVPAGSGALVATRLPNQQDVGDVQVVGDDGQAFEVVDSDALSALGYAPEQVVLVTPAWLGLLPTGPALDRPGIEVVTGAAGTGR